jgi:hypothetical protein
VKDESSVPFYGLVYYLHIVDAVDVIIMAFHGSYQFSILQTKYVDFVITTTSIYMTICLAI